MHTPRWYPTNTTLPDGRILVTAGEINCDGCNALIPEIYNAITNTWTELPAASLDISYYPHMFVLPDGRVLAASSAETAIVTQALDISTQTWSVIDPNAVDGGSAAMYLPGKVLKSGTSTNPDDPTVPSAPTAYVLVRARIRGERFGKWPSSRWIASFKLLPKRYPTLPLLAMGPAKSHSNSFPTAVTNFWPSGSGFVPGDNLLTESRYAGRVIEKRVRISAEGLLPPQVLLHRAVGFDHGAHYAVKGRSCAMAVEYNWGEPALSRR
jgi:hypothetical protein